MDRVFWFEFQDIFVAIFLMVCFKKTLCLSLTWRWSDRRYLERDLIVGSVPFQKITVSLRKLYLQAPVGMCYNALWSQFEFSYERPLPWMRKRRRVITRYALQVPETGADRLPSLMKAPCQRVSRWTVHRTDCPDLGMPAPGTHKNTWIRRLISRGLKYLLLVVFPLRIEGEQMDQPY